MADGIEDIRGLDIEEKPSVEFWESKQRELVTSVVDYNLDTLANLVRSKKIDVSPRYQRRFRWTRKRQSLLIESFLMNVPVPPIFLNEDEYGKYSVIDGKQRLTAITEFVTGRLKLTGLEVFSDINGRTFDDLPDDLQTVILVRPTIRAQIILRQSDSDIKFEVFRRLNTGGVKLNAQEIRNSTHPGEFNDMLLEVSETPLFHRMLRIKDKKSSIYKEMRDVELALRYFAFCDDWREFKGGMKRKMDRHMLHHQHDSNEKIEAMKLDFLSTLEKTKAAFGEFAFRRWQPEKDEWKDQILASVYDAHMFACREFSKDTLENSQEKLIENMKQQFSNPDFRKTIDAATNTPALFKQRVLHTIDMIENSL